MLSPVRRLARRLVLVVVAAGLLALPACADAPKGIKLTAYFPKAVSLYEQGDVKILGLSSGKVTDVEVVDTRVKVEIQLNEGTKVPEDVQATIVPLSLIGERYVQLFPAWTNGEPEAKSGTVIPLERTSIPVEPDEALAALKKFLDTLDPNATGRLVKNLAADLKGNGQSLNDALAEFSELTATLAEKDQQLVGLIENFDTFTATLRTRESQLGRTMDQFAVTTKLLADERDEISQLIKALAQTSSAGLDLISEHGGALNADVQTLTETLKTVHANIEPVRQLLDAAPMMVAGRNLDGEQGLLRSYDPTFKHIDLRNAAAPTVALLLQALGFPVESVCLPIDVECEPSALPLATPSAAATPTPVRQSTAPAAVDYRESSPIVAVVGLLGSEGTAEGDDAAAAMPAASKRGDGGVLGGLRRAARWLTGAFG